MLRYDHSRRCFHVFQHFDSTVVSHEEFVDQQQYIQELEARLAIYAHLAQAMDDVKLGRAQAMDAAIDDILGELDEVRP